MSGIAFVLSGIFWGSSFLWIKIALEELSTFGMVALRLSFGLLGIGVIVLWKRIPLPGARRDYGLLFVYTFLNIFFPFLLIGWSETQIDSGVASVINGTVPIWTMLFAHFTLHDEQMTRRRAAGTLLGFAGVLILASRDLGSLLDGSALGYLAAWGGALSYASAGVFNRLYLRHLHPLMQSLGIIFFGTLITWIGVAIAEPGFALPSRELTWISVAWMGILGTGVAFAMFMYVMNQWGAFRASTVNYMLPAVGLGLGIGVLGEKPSASLFVGGALILLGVAIVQGIRPPWLKKKTVPGVVVR